MSFKTKTMLVAIVFILVIVSAYGDNLMSRDVVDLFRIPLFIAVVALIFQRRFLVKKK